MRKTLRIALLLLAFFLLYIAIVLVHGTLTDWQPAAELPVDTYQTSPEATITDSVISLSIWNIGYAGLGSTADFFFDSGGFFFSNNHMIRPARSQVGEFLAGAALFTRSTAADFFLFQEIDLGSRRSHYTQQLDTLRAQRPTYAASYAANYRVTRVPIPVLEPWRAYGKVEAGIATLSKWQPYAEQRLQLPGSFSWPDRIFQLDRCLLVSRFKTNRSGDLVVINGHLSAYDKGGELKKQQMAFIQTYVQAEYDEGNYVLVGADWNQCPPFFPFDTFSPGKTDGYTQTNIAPDFLPEGWQWIYDPTIPTNRKLRSTYLPGKTFTTVIDFFLISPNIKAVKVKTIDQQFRFSDHQPVYMEIELL
ncbi:MAG: hypothetical protein DA408_07070 [Bacteroidetes bacterium]|nr:MAG: hypothetical protein C7N36_18635 [Bacteroidota bacterium]PTM13360.1 MAG: hypothetical protein DA408_07070 [Bacteroidota bacterium]